MLEVWRGIYAALNDAFVALSNSQALHSRDFSTPEAFAKAAIQLRKDYADLAAMRARALDVFVVWDGVPKVP